jgi:hypothetical protein
MISSSSLAEQGKIGGHEDDQSQAKSGKQDIQHGSSPFPAKEIAATSV